MENKNEIERSLTWIYDIYLLGQKASLVENTQEIQDLLIAKIISVFDATGGCLAEYNKISCELLIVAGIGVPDFVVGSVVKSGTSILSRVSTTGEPLLLNGDLRNDDTYHGKLVDRSGSVPASSMCWPLIVNNEVIGVVSINRDSNKPAFSQHDLVFGQSIIKFIALAVEDARIHIQSNLQTEEQKNVNSQQVVWAEALSWLNRVHSEYDLSADTDMFFESLIFQSALVTNAKWGLICTFQNNNIIRTIKTKGCKVKDDKLNNAISVSINTAGTKKNEIFLIDTHHTNEAQLADSLVNVEPGSYIVSPLYTDDSLRLVILLYLGDIKEPVKNDFITFTLFVDGLLRVLEHQDLLVSLRDSKKALEKEKEEQNILIEELENAHDQLLQSEKLASIGQLAAGVAHEINNPVGYISSNISSLKNYVADMISLLDLYAESEQFIDKKSDIINRIQLLKHEIDIEYIKGDLKELTDESIEGVNRVKQIVQDLKDFSHVDEAEWQWVDVHKGLDSTLNVVNNEIKYKADVIKEYGNLPQIECIPSQLNQVFMNMLVNAAHAIENDRGTIMIRTGMEHDNVWFEFIDTGKGIPPDKINNIFDPFFTTKPVGKGTGLGLSLSYGIIEKHQGKIEVESELGKGTRFKITIPVKSPVADAEEPIH